MMGAAHLGLPVVDADAMGRAFPEAQMTSFAIVDLKMYPLTLADVRDNSVIVATAAAIVVCGLTFSQLSNGMLLIAMGVGLTLASNIMSYSFHAYQTELFPTSIRSTAVGFVYSWSRFSAIFTSFAIAGVLKNFGTTGVFVFIAAAMLIVMAVIGLMGPRTRNLALEEISR